MTVCLEYFYHDKANASLGLRVAIDDWIRAWLRYGTTPRFVVRPLSPASHTRFLDIAATLGVNTDERCVGLNPHTPNQNMANLSCLFRPDPALADTLWRRGQLPGRGYAACGLLHALAGPQVTQALHAMMMAPWHESDALVCPSQAIRGVLLRLAERWGAYVQERFGGQFSFNIQTPVIPLGLDVDKFKAQATPANRQATRTLLGIPDDDVVILYTGRISVATKGHPLPLFRAAQTASTLTKRNLHLVLYGYFLPTADEAAIRQLAATFCPAVHCHFITNDDPRFPACPWGAGDMFTSLIDNVQESFGLTPLEAMAAGLPAVVSAWDGYKDTVVDGETGYLIPTLTPPAEAGDAIAWASFNQESAEASLTGAAQSTFIDTESAARAFARLADEPALRAQMAAHAQKRAETIYDWKNIIPAYEALWQDLAERRRLAPLSSFPAKVLPLDTPNPFALFGPFSSGSLSLDGTLHVVMTNDEISLILANETTRPAPFFLPPPDGLRQLVTLLRQAGTVRLADILSRTDVAERPLLWRCLGWMLKMGICILEA